MTSEDRQLNSRTFLAWKMKFFNFMTFQFFHDLCKYCLFRWENLTIFTPAFVIATLLNFRQMRSVFTF